MHKSPVRENHSPVRVTLKTGKKWQGDSNDQEKRKKDKAKPGGF